MKKRYSKGELAKEILKGLALGGFIVACFALPGLAQVLVMFRPKSSADRYRIKRTIKNLQKQRLVKIYEKDGKEVVEITQKGEKQMLQYRLDDIKINPSKKWDGLWRVVIFDIPQKKKRARDAISFKLKEMGFYPLQRSVFVSPYECRDELDFIGEFFHVRRFIKFLLVKEIENDSKLKKHFNL
jgi:DNA-binding transcriptional regulator PaaX